MANKKNFLIIGAMVVVTVLAFLLINFFSGKGPNGKPAELTEENLQKEIIELERNLLELEVIFDGKEDQIDQLDVLLQESYDRLDLAEQNIDKLEEQIKQMERQGKVDKQTINRLRNQVAEARTRVNEEKLKAYKVEIDLLIRDNGMLTAVKDSMEIVQYQQDSLITAMRTEFADCMTSSNTSIKDPISVDDPVVTAVADNERVAGFYASNIRITLIGKRKKVLRPLSSVKDVETIEFRIDVEGVDPVPRGRQDIYIEVISPGGKAVTNPKNSGSGGVFYFNGREKVYTLKTYLNYQGKKAEVSTEYLTGDNFPSGESIINFYCDNKLIGNKKILLSS